MIKPAVGREVGSLPYTNFENRFPFPQLPSQYSHQIFQAQVLCILSPT